MAGLTVERHVLDDADEVAHVLRKCISGREVVVRLRNPKTEVVKIASIVCPAGWTRGRLLAYARRCHPNETVRIMEWKSMGTDDDPWHPRLWIVNPQEMI